MLRKIILLLFTLFMFIFLDGISIKKVLHGYSYFIVIYALVLLVMKFLETIINNKRYNKKFTLKIGNSEKIIISVILLYILNMFRYAAEPFEGIRILSFLIIAYINGYFLKKYGLIKEYLWIFYAVSFFYIIRQFIDAGMPFYSFKNLSSIFMQNRSRILFGFYHVNAAGNLAACSIIISFFLIYFTLNYSSKILKIYIISMIVVIDFVILSYLFDAASRTAILSIIIWLIFFFYYNFIELKIMTNKLKFVVRLAVLIFTVFIIFDSLGMLAYSFFVSSHRMSNFTGNLPLLNSLFKVLFGLGVSSPGTVAVYQPVDNYYLYILLNFGAIGLIYLVFVLMFLGFNLHKLFNSKPNKIFMMTFCVFICHLIAGMSETCVLYYLFPSSLIYWILYFSCLNANVKVISNCRQKFKINKLRFK